MCCDEKDRPTLEDEEDAIEVTDEMADAGVAAYGDSDPRYMRRSSIVIAVYRAMAVRDPARCAETVPPLVRCE